MSDTKNLNLKIKGKGLIKNLTDRKIQLYRSYVDAGMWTRDKFFKETGTKY